MFRSVLSVLAIVGFFTINPLSLEAQESELNFLETNQGPVGRLHGGKNCVPPCPTSSVSSAEEEPPHGGKNMDYLIYLGEAYVNRHTGELMIIPPVTEEQNLFHD